MPDGLSVNVTEGSLPPFLDVPLTIWGITKIAFANPLGVELRLQEVASEETRGHREVLFAPVDPCHGVAPP